MSTTCPKCQTNNPDESKFCMECGTPLLDTEDGLYPDGPTLTASPSKIQSAPLKQHVGFSLKAGQKFGPYKIIRPLGKGGMGAVYEAEHVENVRRVAVKILHQTLGSQTDRERFLSEGRLAASFNHPNSVYIYGTEEIEKNPVISMELLPGGTLKDRVKKEGPLPPVEAVDVILQVIEGLEAAQSVGILHRDIKPSNCFVDVDGTTKIGDFGLSLSTLGRTENQMEADGSYAGTPSFSSPEQIRGEELDVRSDIFSTGATLYYLLTGKLLFEETNPIKLMSLIQEEEPQSPHKIFSEVSKGLAGVVLQSLAKNRLTRFSSYSELRKALMPYSSTFLAPAKPSLRIKAKALDYLLFLIPFIIFLTLAVRLALPDNVIDTFSRSFMGLLLLYLTLSEGLWGTSIGKKIIKVRVIGPHRDVPGIFRAFLRNFVILLLYFLFLRSEKLLTSLLKPGHESEPGPGIGSYVLIVLFALCGYVLFSTARQKNGFAGLHDLISKTRVVFKPVDKSLSFTRPAAESIPAPEIQKYIGPYLILNELRKNETDTLLLAYDEQLKRKVWIHILPVGSPAVSVLRGDVYRSGRLRWIIGKRTSTENWDVYESVEGKPLINSLTKSQDWKTVRNWLLDLAQELSAASKDQTLPFFFGLDRIWITTEGRVKLLDFSAPGMDPNLLLPEPLKESDGNQTTGLFLKQIALSALEGKIKTLEEIRNRAPSVPLPLHARVFLKNLRIQKKADLTSVFESIILLISEEPKVSKIKRLRILEHNLVLFLLYALIGVAQIVGGEFQWWFIGLGVLLGCWGVLNLLTTFVFRSGLSFLLLGVAIVKADGRLASRKQTLFRSFVAWSPIFLCNLILLFSVGKEIFEFEKLVLIHFPWWIYFSLVAVCLAGAVMAVLNPERGPQDKIAKTYLVTR